MRGVFDQEEETGRMEHRQDTEFTLGSGSLLALFVGLLLLCGVCFGWGYSVGHHNPAAVARNGPQAAPEQEPLQASGNIPKPSAIAQTPVAPPPDATAPQAAPGAGQAQQPVVAGASAPASTPPTYPQVHPALASGAGPQAYAAGAVQNVHSALPSQPFMVQIAAVSNPDDAEVLVGALRKRNYPVVARRDPVDSFIHVRIGPFASRAIAEQWRMKLLNDGYNAEIQP